MYANHFFYNFRTMKEAITIGTIKSSLLYQNPVRNSMFQGRKIKRKNTNKIAGATILHNINNDQKPDPTHAFSIVDKNFPTN